jgi:shikimate kinase
MRHARAGRSTSTTYWRVGVMTAERHVVLIGLPGAGKTNAGRKLAKVLQRPFADADEQLELAVGTTIPRVFHGRGEAELRRLEGEVLADLLSRTGPLVVSAAGGTEIGDDLRALLASSAVAVWLRGSVGFLTQLSDPTHRPRVADGHEAALARLERELSTVYGEIADHTVDVEPFHGLGGQARDALVSHIVHLLTDDDPRGWVRLPPSDPAEIDGYVDALARAEREASAHLDDIADHVVDVEPFHALGGEPRRTIARHIAELLGGPGATRRWRRGG